MRGLRALGIRKYFLANGVEALSGADFSLHPGEIHALVGENGAGKSTLVQILAGAIEPSAGHIEVDGIERHFRNPAEALAEGIGLVRQHPRFVPGFRLWEDCALGAEPGSFGLFDGRTARAELDAIACRWGFDLNVDARMEDLAVSQMQKAALLALLFRKIKYFLLDEPTAVLAPIETDRLFEVLRSLRGAGHGIVLISHKLPEVVEIADRVTVLRAGKVVATGPVGELTEEEIRSLAFRPSARSPGPNTGTTARRTRSGGDDAPSALIARGLKIAVPGKPHVRGLDLRLEPGKITGIAGVRESGLETLELGLAGFLPIKEGEISLFGTRVEGRGPRAVREAGAVFVPGDRMGVALAPRLPLWINAAVHQAFRARGFLDSRYLKDHVASIMATARVTGSPRDLAAAFSGGTLQRLILARELSENPRLLLLAEPGWGLDETSRAELEDRIRRLAAAGRAIALFSTDLDELLTLCDEILVLRDGSIVDRFSNREDATTTREELRERIGAAMIGAEACHDA